MNIRQIPYAEGVPQNGGMTTCRLPFVADCETPLGYPPEHSPITVEYNRFAVNRLIDSQDEKAHQWNQ